MYAPRQPVERSVQPKPPWFFLNQLGMERHSVFRRFWWVIFPHVLETQSEGPEAAVCFFAFALRCTFVGASEKPEEKGEMKEKGDQSSPST